jgi:hypothetical protein
MDRNLGFSEESANRQAIIGVCSLLQILSLGEIALLKHNLSPKFKSSQKFWEFLYSIECSPILAILIY